MRKGKAPSSALGDHMLGPIILQLEESLHQALTYDRCVEPLGGFLFFGFFSHLATWKTWVLLVGLGVLERGANKNANTCGFGVAFVLAK